MSKSPNTRRRAFAFILSPPVVLPDTDRDLLGIGAEWMATDYIEIDGAFEHSFPFAHPTMNISVNYTDPITHAVVLQGNHGVDVNIVALGARYRL
ncbi:MAG TPA: hypothetical protein VMO78_17250 [Rhizomicrobium sp.]|nr:hypothetical protein [Rhizomicrobium sp.]